MKFRIFLVILLGIGLTALIVMLLGLFPGALADGGWANLTYLLILLLVVGSGVLLGRDIGIKFALNSVVVWIAIFAFVVLGYSFRHDLERMWGRISGELRPAAGQQAGPRAIAYRQSGDGHYHIEAKVNGASIRFLVDTGATDIVLSQDDARRAGIDPAKLNYTRVYSTANGTVRGAPVDLRRLVVGPLQFTGVRASVNEGRMRGSVLGMTFLRRFRSYDVTNGVLTLRY